MGMSELDMARFGSAVWRKEKGLEMKASAERSSAPEFKRRYECSQ